MLKEQKLTTGRRHPLQGRLVTGGLGSSISMLNNNQEQHFYHQASDWFDAPAEGETEMAPPLSTLPHQEKGAAATQDTKPKADLSGLPIEELARRLGEKISANDSNQLMPAVPVRRLFNIGVKPTREADTF